MRLLDKHGVVCQVGVGARAETSKGGAERGQRNVEVVNLLRIVGALDMSLSELFAEVEGKEGRGGG